MEQVLKEEGYTSDSHSKSYPYTRKFLKQRNPGCPQSMQERKIIKETFIFKASIFIKQCCPQPVCCECVKYMACYTAYLSHVIVNLLVYQAM